MQVQIIDPEQLVMTISDFLMPEECKAYIATSESRGYAPAPLTTSRGPVMDTNVRSNHRVMLDDPAVAKGLWNRVRQLVPQVALDWEDVPCQAVGLNERLRFFRYEKNQKFARHYDGAYHRTSYEHSLLTFMVYLNDDFQGGETRFFNDYQKERFFIQPRRGSALLFVHNQMHEGSSVLEGCKYVLRSDVMYRRKTAHTIQG